MRVAIVGVGGHGRECALIAEAMAAAGAHIEVAGFYDDAPSDVNLMRLRRLGYHLLGAVDDLTAADDLKVCLAVGSSASRVALQKRLQARGVSYASLIHPDSTIGRDVLLGEGSVIFAGARLTTSIDIGRHVHVNQNVTIGHDARLGDFTTVNPSATVSGAVVTGAAVTIGANACVLQGLHIGNSATVGASACVVKNVAEAQTVKGVPAL